MIIYKIAHSMQVTHKTPSPSLEHTSHPTPVPPFSKLNNLMLAGRACTAENIVIKKTFTIFTIPEFHCFFQVLQIF